MKFKTFMLLVFAMILLTGCGTSLQKEDEENQNIQTSVKDSPFPGIEIETEIGEYDEYKYALHFPKTESDAINDEIQTFISQQRAQFLDLTRNKELADNTFSELNLDFEITHISDSFLSIVFTNTINIPESSQISTINTLNFNLLTDSVFTLKDILSDESSLEYLQKLSEKQLLQNSQLTELVKSDQLNEGLSSKLKNYDTFNLLDQSLNFHFDSKQFPDCQIDSFNVSLTYNSLAGIIDSTFLQSIYQVASTKTELLSDTVFVTESNIATLDPAQKYVALTFDDGPHKDFTPQILDTLKKYNAKATFYVLGNRVSYYPDIVKRAYAEEHEIGNHTRSHPNLTRLSQEDLIEEINSASNEIAKLTGKMPSTIRPPYGAYDQTVQDLVSMPIILWSIDTLDWKHKNSNRIKQVIQTQVTDGSIILMHDIQQASADALEDVLINLTRQGYQMVTVSELLQLTNPSVAYANQVYTNK